MVSDNVSADGKQTMLSAKVAVSGNEGRDEG